MHSKKLNETVVKRKSEGIRKLAAAYKKATAEGKVRKVSVCHK